MRRSFVVWQGALEKLTKDPKLDIIIIGTGAMARDAQRKLRLLNLNVSFLVGEHEDAENGIRHYSCIAELKPIERYFFVVCEEDRRLTSSAQSAMYKALGIATTNHPRVLYFRGLEPAEPGDCYYIDAQMHEILTRNDRSYVKYGNPSKDSFNIHIYGSCLVSSILHHTRKPWSEWLYEKLQAEDFPAVIYAWGNPKLKRSDCLMQLLRDGSPNKADLVIVYAGLSIFASYQVLRNNLIPVLVGPYSPPFVGWMHNSYASPIGNGLQHSIDSVELWKMQQRIFCALSRQIGFTFWSIIPPSSITLPEEQSYRLTKLPVGYLARARQLKQDILSAVDSSTLKDYTDSFTEVENIFDMYISYNNLTDSGNEIIAERCKNDIISTFGKKMKEMRD